MYRCHVCKTDYKMSEANYSYLSEQIKNNPVVETIISCPGCQLRRIVGGELEYDDIREQDIIMMFGRDLKSTDNFLKEFKGVKED